MAQNFLSEAPLCAQAREVLIDAFDQGWHDPLKLSQGASKARTLYQEALESIASGLNTHPTELEFIGEPSFGHFLALQGLANPTSTIFYSSADRKEVHSIARSWKFSTELAVNQLGMINQDKLRESKNGDVFALQGANGETGVLQDLEYLTHAFLSGAPEGRICLDFTSVGARRALPSSWDTALFDSRSWNGPQGLGVLAIKNGSSWRNPLPHLDVARAPRSFSLPLLIASAVALESWNREEEKIRHLSQRLRDGIRSTISDCDVAGELSQSLPHINSFSFLYVEGEELLRSLERRGFLVDSGSACTSEDLQPSHVLAAMGLLTHGNIRVTIKEETKEKDIDELLIAVRSSVEELRV